MKDNTGYDLVGLLCGSEGTLAVVTAARLRLIPEPAERVVALLGVASIDDAVSLSGRLRRCDGIEAIEVFGADEAELAADTRQPRSPLPTVAAGHGPGRGGRVRSGRPDCTRRSRPTTVYSRWRSRPHQRPAATSGRIRELITDALLPLGPVLKLDVTLPGAGVPIFLERTPAAGHRSGADRRALWVFGHLGDGNLHVNLTGHHATDEAAERALTDTILTLVAEHHGSISAEHGIGVAERDRGSTCHGRPMSWPR